MNKFLHNTSTAIQTQTLSSAQEENNAPATSSSGKAIIQNGSSSKKPGQNSKNKTLSPASTNSNNAKEDLENKKSHTTAPALQPCTILCQQPNNPLQILTIFPTNLPTIILLHLPLHTIPRTNHINQPCNRRTRLLHLPTICHILL